MLKVSSMLNMSKILRRSCFTKDMSLDFADCNIESRYIHISPAGDAWIAGPLIGAKHLASDYLRSIHISYSNYPVNEKLIEQWLQTLSLNEIHKLYDDGKLPISFPVKCA
jgi:hypothetical protein